MFLSWDILWVRDLAKESLRSSSSRWTRSETQHSVRLSTVQLSTWNFISCESFFCLLMVLPVQKDTITKATLRTTYNWDWLKGSVLQSIIIMMGTSHIQTGMVQEELRVLHLVSKVNRKRLFSMKLGGVSQRPPQNETLLQKKATHPNSATCWTKQPHSTPWLPWANSHTWV